MSSDPSAPVPKRRLLLVDDEQDVLDSLRLVLERGIPGLEVVTAASGQQGLAELEGKVVDLIVSDFRMPNMDGIEFLERCGLRHPKVPRAILTAFLVEDLRRSAPAAAGISAFLSKGDGPRRLVDWVRHRLDSLPSVTVATLAKAGLPGL